MTTAQFSDDQDKSRQPLIRTLTHLLNQGERHFRHYMVSQEGLQSHMDDNQHRSDMGIGEILKMLMLTNEEQKKNNEKLEEKVDMIVEHLKIYDHVQIPKDQMMWDEE